MNRGANQSQQGFTIIELLLAMTFVAVLLLTIAVTVIQIGNIYNKGLTMRSVDQAGRVITADMRRVISQSEPFNTETNLVFLKHPESEVTEPDGGRLCTGQFTYVWNYGKSLASGSPINVYDTSDDGEGEQIRFVRIRDNGGSYCLAANAELPVLKADAIELLSDGNQNLAIQSLSIEQIATNANIGQALYQIILEVGTNNQSALEQVISSGSTDAITTIDTSCRPPSDDESLQDFCAVNQFDFTASAGSKGGL